MAEWRVTGVTESERVVVMAMLDACFDGFSVSALGRGKCQMWWLVGLVCMVQCRYVEKRI